MFSITTEKQQQKEWTNYECAVFAKALGQIEFYKSGLVEGAIVEITGQQLKIKTFEGQNVSAIKYRAY